MFPAGDELVLYEDTITSCDGKYRSQTRGRELAFGWRQTHQPNKAPVLHRRHPQDVQLRNDIPSYAVCRTDVVLCLAQSVPCPRCKDTGLILQDRGIEQIGAALAVAVYCKSCREELRLGQTALDVVNRRDMRSMAAQSVFYSLAVVMRGNSLTPMYVHAALVGLGTGMPDSFAYEVLSDTGIRERILAASKLDSADALKRVIEDHLERCATIAHERENAPLWTRF